MTVGQLAALLTAARNWDRAEEAKQYRTGTAAQIEMSTFTGNPERQAQWLLAHDDFGS